MLEKLSDNPLVQRDTLRFLLDQLKLTLVSMWLVMSVIAWLGIDAGRHAQSMGLMVLATVGALWRLFLVRRTQRALQQPDAPVDGLALPFVINLAFAGLVWVYCCAAIYPGLSTDNSALFAMILIANVTGALFMLSTLRGIFWVLVTPAAAALMTASLCLRDVPMSPVVVFLLVLYLVVMRQSAMSLRRVTILAFERGQEMAQTNLVLRQAMAAAEAAAHAKTRFLATMSHELRTPLGGLLGALELVGRTDMPPAQRRLVDVASASGEGLLAVVNDVLDYAKVDAGQLTITARNTDLHALVDSVVTLFRAPAHAKGLVLRAQVNSAVPAWVMADGQRLRQVLLNLVGNAVKFTDMGEINVIVKPGADTSAGAGSLRFEVSDTGVGITPEDKDILFKPFVQLQQDSDRSHGGTGLGLAISQRLVQAMGGRIDVRSRPGDGSCFGFELVLPRSEPPMTQSNLGRVNWATLPKLQGRVLLVEDNEVNRLVALELLHVLGLQTQVAEQGQRALQILAVETFDLVLMDCQMPVMDGYEATRRWREQERALGPVPTPEGPRTRHLPILALTANVMSDDVQRARNSGMDDLLGKPYTIEQLATLLKRWLPEAAPAAVAGGSGQTLGCGAVRFE